MGERQEGGGTQDGALPPVITETENYSLHMGGWPWSVVTVVEVVF